MKKYIYSFAVCAALFCTSCDESRLNIEQKAVSSTENFYKTDQDAIDAMTAAYAQFLDNVCSSAGIYQPQFTLLNYSADDVSPPVQIMLTTWIYVYSMSSAMIQATLL